MRSNVLHQNDIRDGDSTARSQDTISFSIYSFLIRNQIDDAVGYHDIGSAVWKLKPRHIANDKLSSVRQASLTHRLRCPLKHLRGEIYPNHPPTRSYLEGG